ncbi:MAG: AbrB/MazE/SpoVT family DNA-binding domain-containing protein [Chloroflexota bacterium]|nr:AbrB/MazE/SpoVT family DNA-binding domain-containing protein [Chloroflexota bacterium]
MVIDKAGRIVVPKSIREQLRLTPGTELEAGVEGGQLVARPVGPEAILARRNGRLVFTTTEPVPTMTQDELLQMIDESREWPHHT